MSRTQSQGIDYFPLAVDFFSDRKTKILKARYGDKGVLLCIDIFCQIYREGFYTRVDEDFYYILSEDHNMSTDTVEQVLTFLLKRSMFNEQLFKSDAILTSTGIQERWQKAVATRASKTPIEVDERYWLLSKDKTRPFIKLTQNNSSEKNPVSVDHSSKKIADNSESYSQSKVKESKVNNNITHTARSAREGEDSVSSEGSKSEEATTVSQPVNDEDLLTDEDWEEINAAPLAFRDKVKEIHIMSRRADIREQELNSEENKKKEFEEKYKSFVRYWGIKEDNYNPRIAEFDFNELHRMYQNSEKFLQVTPCCRVLSWIVKNYDSIIAGKFSDRVATGKRSSG